MTALKVTTTEDGVTVVLTPELAAQLQVPDGGEIHAVRSQNGVELIASSEIAHQLEVARRVMKEDRETLSHLAE